METIKMTFPSLPEGFEIVKEKSKSKMKDLPSGFEIMEEKKSPRAKSLLTAPFKGVLKEAARTADQLSPLFPGPRIPQQEEIIEQVLPTEDKPAERILERAGGIAPYLVGGGGGMLAKILRSLTAAGLGELGSQIGGKGGELVGELAGLGLPGLRKKIIPSAAQKELVDLARRQGLTEKQIAPLIQSEGKRRILGKIAEKGKKVQETLQEAKKGAGELYQKLRGSPEAKQSLSPEVFDSFEESTGKILKDLDPAGRKKVTPIVRELMQGEFTPDRLIRAYTHLNKVVKSGYGEAGRLMEPIEAALEKSGGEIAKDFKLTRQLYKQGAELRKSLKPKFFDKLLEVGKWGQVAAGILTGNLSYLATALGEKGAQRLATNLLTNPRYQNIGKQVLQAVNQGKFSVAKKIINNLDSNLPQASRDLPSQPESQKDRH